jgi:2-C-methyl-D-erythritol 2,4-cyclodiphosphate synthase
MSGTTNRVGLGFDVHPFGLGQPLVLGGVVIPGEPGLMGHSDADVVAHAIADALLSAAGQADLGTLFPATDETPRGASSLEFVEEIARIVAAERWRIVNVAVVVAAERPRLAPYVVAMRERVAWALSAARRDEDDVVPVTITPKRAEGLGAIGRAEGVAAWAVASVERHASAAAS